MRSHPPNRCYGRGSSFGVTCCRNYKLDFTVLIFWLQHCSFVKLFNWSLRSGVYRFYHLRLVCCFWGFIIITLRPTICDEFWQFLLGFCLRFRSKRMLLWCWRNYHLWWNCLWLNRGYSEVRTCFETRIGACFSIHKIGDTSLVGLRFACLQKVHLAQFLETCCAVDDLLKRICRTLWRFERKISLYRIHTDFFNRIVYQKGPEKGLGAHFKVFWKIVSSACCWPLLGLDFPDKLRLLFCSCVKFWRIFLNLII